MVVLVGVKDSDGEKDCEYLAKKIANLRIFSDERGKLNLSLLDTKGEALVISQFTLYGDCRRGRRPSFTEAAPPEKAQRLYLKFIECLEGYGVKVERGRFQAKMLVDIHNEGPVTLVLET
jgi:D-tyrosyl-tRNA(Tyr) deacylase